MTSALATYSATVAGMTITTAGSDADQSIVAPHLDTKQTAWTGTKWGTENQVHWECGIRTSSAIDNQKIWAGLKLTNDQLPQTDANQAYFYFATDETVGQVLSTYTPLYFIYSIAGADYLTNLGITVAASTNYHLKITMDSDRKLSVFVNGEQYGLATTATLAWANLCSKRCSGGRDLGGVGLSFFFDLRQHSFDSVNYDFHCMIKFKIYLFAFRFQSKNSLLQSLRNK